MTMDPADPQDRLRRVDQIFDRALDVDEPDRDAFIRSECGDDPGLFTDVMALAAASTDAESYFEGHGKSLLGRVWHRLDSAEDPGGEDDSGSLEDERLGPYHLVERIARGGMGSVYRALRVDGRFSSAVALKVLRRGLDTEDVIGRFSAERHILAGLEHPNIARILDAGETPDGRPYLVMELVDGQPILEYCRSRDAPLSVRLDLFAEVCEAVAYAHRHHVVHRDLKSTNILVADEQRADTHRPVVKLLDFGIAKVLDSSAELDSKGLTRTGVRMLTPRCASPEQIDGKPITPASDVYQLGVLLYELLSGQSPYLDKDGEPLDGRALEEAIRAVDPPAPSRRAEDTEDLPTAAIRGDIDAIVLQAMRKEPAERYESVLALAADLAAYRLGQPVAASAGSRWYRTRKFVRRHRVGVAVAAATGLLILGWAVTATVQNRALTAERDRVRAEAVRTTAIRDFLVGMFEASDPFTSDLYAGDSTSARELLDAGAQRLATDFEDEPLVRAELAFTIGKTYRSLSLDDESRRLLEEALQLQTEAFGPQSRAVARTLFELGALFRTTDGDSAAALLDRALAVAETAFDSNDPFIAEVLTILGEHLAFTERPDTLRSRELRERAVTILRSIPDAPRAQLAEALTISTYGLNEQMELVVERMSEALAIRRELYGDAHPAIASSLNDLSLALEASGRPERADSMMEAALDIFLATLGDSHTATLDAMGNMASHYRDIRKDYSAAEALYTRNIALAREHRPEDRLALAYPVYGLAVTLMKMERFEEAEPRLRVTLRLLVEEFGWGNGLSFTTRSTLGECLRNLGRLDEAATVLESSRAGFADAPWIRLGHKLATLRELRLVYELQERSGDVAAVDSEVAELERN